MCGICGYVDMENGIDTDLLVSMTNTARHRGPDDEGYALAGKNGVTHYCGSETHSDVRDNLPYIVSAAKDDATIGFGHRRLSIIDTSSGGHQPMEKHNKIIVYNGMIYNYIELREELRAQGYEFTGNCDTEVILTAYDCWGTDCVTRFNGMWAFAIYDADASVIFLSRDRFGVKPLYYYKSGNKFIFSSEIKQLLADSSIERRVNAEIMSNYLLYGYIDYSEQTFFENISQLRGGYNALIKLDYDKKQINEFEIRQYYDTFNIAEEQSSQMQASQITGDELTRAVSLRLRSDVKLGSCLSGGLDSSSIVALVCQKMRDQGLNPMEFETVSSAYKDSPEADETIYSHAVAEHCGCSENIIFTDIGDVQRELEKVCRHEDEPTTGFYVHQWRVYEKAAALGCKVLLDGQGGDETLGGYNRYLWAHLYDTLRTKGLIAFAKDLRGSAKNTKKPLLRALFWVFFSRLKTLRVMQMRYQNKRYFSKNTKKNRNDKVIKELLFASSGARLHKVDLVNASIPVLLHGVDRTSMAHGLEVRLPFMDYKFVEAAVAIPYKEKAKDGYTKYPLREFVNGMLPDEVVWRRHKLGFATPGKKWIYELDREYVMDLLDNARSAMFFKTEKLKKDYQKRKVNIEAFTRFIMTEVWMRVFDVSA